MRKFLVAIATIISIIALFVTFTACHNNNKAETTTATTITTTTAKGVKFEDLPEAITETTVIDYTEELKEIYKNLGLEHVCWFDGGPEIEGNKMYISACEGCEYLIQSICPTVSFLEAHDIEFFGEGIEKCKPDTVTEEEVDGEGALIPIYESDEEHVIIKWDGKMKMVIDEQYVVVFNSVK